MATLDESKSFQEKLEEITRYSVTSLVTRPDKWGTLNFKEVEHVIEIVLEVAQELTELPVKYVPSSALSSMSSNTDSIVESLGKIDSLDLNSNFDINTKQTITDEITTNGEAFITSCSEWVAFLSRREQDVQEHVRELKASKDEVEREAETFRSRMQSSEREVEEIVSAARKAAAEAGVATFTHQFNAEAESLKKRSSWWLGVTVLLSAVTIASSVGLYFHNQEAFSDSISVAAINLTIAKLSIVAILVAVSFWCGRIYKSFIGPSLYSQPSPRSKLANVSSLCQRYG